MSMDLKKIALRIINYVKFTYFLSDGIFGSGSPRSLLRLISKFTELEAPFYSKRFVMGRGPQKSAELLNSLVEAYARTKSETTLNQILEVLKREFILREEQ